MAAVAFAEACVMTDIEPTEFTPNPPIVFANEPSQGWLDAFDVDGAELEGEYGACQS